MNKTLIEWVKNPDGSQGFTWNPVTGCLNHIDGFCKGGGFKCYAYSLANGRLRERYLANINTAPRLYGTPIVEDILVVDDPFYPRFWEERLNEVFVSHWQKPRGIFPCDMSDLFGIGIPLSWTLKILDAIRKCPLDRFYLLTKQPQNLIKWSPFPDNCWVGVTATNDKTYMDGLKGLLDVVAKVKFISFEPLLEEVINNNRDHGFCNLLAYCRINWVIIGAQTKPYKPPKIEWVEEIVRAADKAGVKVFLKDNLKTLVCDALARHEIDRGQFFVGRDLRQEIPE